MQPEDVPAVATIDRACFTLPWSEETFDAECRFTTGYYRVAVRSVSPDSDVNDSGGNGSDGDEVVGFLGSQMVEDEAHITTFGVAPAHRRQGLADLLMADFLREAVLRRGCLRLTLEVRASNAGAIHLYRKWGFLPVSLRKRYYTDNDEDALVLWIEDASRPGFRALLTEQLQKISWRE